MAAGLYISCLVDFDNAPRPTTGQVVPQWHRIVAE